ncbi:MAG: 4-hydroxy-tetrahydrodipicolinate synthase [Deltaproteobacteria bacterium]|nr:4-hydroxy-tetrahydrodipicolinate synthase [Deltaproteobacteria bacterium]MBW2693449.1 4-hydroxy-tetrahydrodipicolinate synthase [Deltaproteobacteria bacterium]
MFEGLSTALITPFRDDAIDETALRELVERQVAAGVKQLVPCGSTGESATLSHFEHGKVIEIVVSAVRGRVQVLAGTGSNNTREAIELTQHAKTVGADGALLISPYYNKPTQQGIYEHYRAVAEQTQFPLVTYNIPGRTGSNIAPSTLARLSDVPHIVGVKEACGDIGQIAEVVALCDEEFAILSGDDGLNLPIMAVGGKGAISTASNVAPEAVGELMRACEENDFARARELHFRMLPLFEALFLETNPIPVKCALELMGLIGSAEVRLPLTPITEANRERLQVSLKELGLL